MRDFGGLVFFFIGGIVGIVGFYGDEGQFVVLADDLNEGRFLEFMPEDIFA